MASPHGDEVGALGAAGVGREELVSLPRLLLGAALRWIFTLGLFGGVGFVACVSAYFVLAPALWSDVPGIPAARAGGAGALLAVFALLARPAGYVTLIYFLVFPVGFAFFGHQVGIARALAHLAQGRSGPLARALAGRSWPLVRRLSESRRVEVSGSKARTLLVSTEEGGLRRRALGFVLGAAKVPELVASAEFLSRVKAAPEAARGELEARIEGAIREWTAASLFIPLGFALGALALVTAGLAFWLSG